MGDSIRVYAGAVAIVTGGGSGIGEAISSELARRGAYVFVTDVRLGEAERVASAIRASRGTASALELDVRDARQFEETVVRVIDERGRLDFLFNNAGIGVAGEVQDLGLDDWRAIVDINILGVVHGVHAAYPRMIDQGFGHIVNTASMAGLMPFPSATPYGMTKAAVVSLSHSLRIEAKRYGVRVSALCPGVIRTPLLSGGEFGRFSSEVDRAAIRGQLERAFPMDVDKFAARVLDAVARDESTVIVPSWWRAMAALHRLSPALAEVLDQVGYRSARASAGGERSHARVATRPPAGRR